MTWPPDDWPDEPTLDEVAGAFAREPEAEGNHDAEWRDEARRELARLSSETE